MTVTNPSFSLSAALRALLLGVTTFSPILQAAELHVPKQHSTVQAAVTAAGPGDTVVVAAGVHAGPVTVPSTKAGLRIVGEGKVWIENDPTPVETGAVFRIQAANVTLEGLGIRHGGANGADPISGGVNVIGDGVTLKKLRIHRSKGPAVRVVGDGARVVACQARGGRDGVLVFGDDALVANCDLRTIQGDGIAIDGKNATVRGCSVVRARKCGIRVKKGGATVRKNKVVAAGEEGIAVHGSVPDIFDNEVRMTGGGAPSILVVLDSDHTITTPGRIRNNRCFDGDGAGIRMSGEGTGRIDKNKVARCGVGAAFTGTTAAGIEAFGKHVLDNDVTDCAGDGIRASGHTTLVVGNRILGCLEDGLQITGGTNIEVRDNVTRSNFGEGFENGGSGTVFIGNVSKKNRIDVASTGTFGAYANNKVKTGGPDQTPEVD